MHVGKFNNQGFPIISDNDITVAEFALNVAPFISLTDEPKFESGRLEQKSNTLYDVSSFLQFVVRTKRKACTKEISFSPDIEQDEIESPHQSQPSSQEVKSIQPQVQLPEKHSQPHFHVKHRRTLSRQNSNPKTSLFPVGRSRTDNIITSEVNEITHTESFRTATAPASNQYTKQLEDKVHILEMKISTVVQQNHNTNQMYEDLLKEVEMYRSSSFKRNEISTLSHLFPQKFPRNAEEAQRDLYMLEENYSSLQRDYYKLLKQNETLSDNLSKSNSENRKLQSQNEELNNQLLTVLNEHYKLLSQQLSEKSGPSEPCIPTIASNTISDILESLNDFPVQHDDNLTTFVSPISKVSQGVVQQKKETKSLIKKPSGFLLAKFKSLDSLGELTESISYDNY